MRLLPALLFLLLAWPARSEPALFVAHGPGITVYLLGSMHALKRGTVWEGAPIRRAFEASSECWFELVLPDDQASSFEPLLERGLDPAHPLSTLLTSADWKALAKRVVRSGYPLGMTGVNMMRPWLAWLVLAGSADSGLRPQDGVDLVLQTQAKEGGKTVVGLETVESQLSIFADQPKAAMVKLLHDTLARPAGPDRSDRLVRHWLEGDVLYVGRLMNQVVREVGPRLGNALIQRRNQAWALRLALQENSAKTILVTVGAGHLAGAGNLREQLTARHWTVARVH